MGRRTYGTYAGRGRVYIAVRSDGYVVVTDRLRDARRALKAKRVGVLKWYGNVHRMGLWTGRDLRRVKGIYTLDEIRDVLAEIYSRKGWVERRYRELVDSARNIVRAPRRKEREERPVKILEPRDTRLTWRIVRKAIDAGWYESVVLCEFKDRYAAVVREPSRDVYISVRKGVTDGELASYLATVDPRTVKEIARAAESVLLTARCGEDDELCKAATELFGRVLAVASLMM